MEPSSLQGVLDRYETRCGRCGYDLRGSSMLKAGGVCPECGLEVSVRTLLGGETREARMRRIGRVRRATWIGALIGLVGLGLLVGAAVVMGW